MSRSLTPAACFSIYSRARLNIVTHQKREHALGFDRVFHRNLNHLAAFGVHRGLPKLMGVHFAQTFVTLNLKSLPAVLLDLLKKLRQRVDLNLVIPLLDAEDRSLPAEQDRRIVTAFAVLLPSSRQDSASKIVVMSMEG